MECGAYYKIGISDDPIRRLEQVEGYTKAPTKLLLIAKANKGRTIDTETVIHHELNCYNVPMPYKDSNTVSREWFFGSIDKIIEVVSRYAEVREITQLDIVRGDEECIIFDD
jgi:hypothetical protein